MKDIIETTTDQQDLTGKVLVTHSHFFSTKIFTQVGTEKEKMRRTAAGDLRIIATMLTMMKTLKAMNKTHHIPEFTVKELIVAIDSLQKGKWADSKDIKAGDLKGVDEETTKLIHVFFNLIIKQDSITPRSWKNVMITVICKNKGDPTKEENCRPICTLPMLYFFLHDALQ